MVLCYTINSIRHGNQKKLLWMEHMKNAATQRQQKDTVV
jgi:hypothetical protein